MKTEKKGSNFLFPLSIRKTEFVFVFLFFIYKDVAVVCCCSLSHCCDCRRKSLSGQWKTNLGQSILEEVPVIDRYKAWIDAVSRCFLTYPVSKSTFNM